MALTRSEGHPRDTSTIFRERVKALMRERHMSAGELARAAGLTRGWASQFLSGKRNLKVTTQQRVAAFFGYEAWQLSKEEDETSKPTSEPGFAALPILPRAIAAGSPIDVGQVEDATEWIAFKDEFTRRFRQPIALRVGRDQQSMLPTIHPGDLIVIDQNEQGRVRPNPRLIYALNIDGGGTVKRVEVVDGRLIVSSDNLDKDKYPTYTRPIHDVDMRTIIRGEVVWIGRYIGSGRKR